MERPKIILRFRNFASGGISGIQAHQEIIKQATTCWWGWWKRADERDQRKLLASLNPPFEVILISLSEELQFRASVRAVLYDRDPPDINRVPDYYRDRVREIAAWFELTSIDEVPFDQKLKESIGTSTDTLFEALFDASQIVVRANDSGRPFVQIDMASAHVLQISDIHLGQDHNFLMPGQRPISSPEPAVSERRLTLVQAIAEDLERLGVDRIGAVIVSGDIVTQCNWKQDLVIQFFKELTETLKVPLESLLIVPGNHDFYRVNESPDSLLAINYKHENDFRLFLAELFNRRPSYSLHFAARLKFDFGLDLFVGLLNSARWTSAPGFHEYGFVGKEVYQAILGDLRYTTGKPCARMLVLHHHLLPVEPIVQPGSAPKSPVSVTLDAAELLADAQDAGVSLVLHGHQHRPAVMKTSRLRRVSGTCLGLDEDIYVFGAGSAGSNQLAPSISNTYSLFSFSSQDVHCRVRELDPSFARDRTYLEAKVPLRLIGV